MQKQKNYVASGLTILALIPLAYLTEDSLPDLENNHLLMTILCTVFVGGGALRVKGHQHSPET